MELLSCAQLQPQYSLVTFPQERMWHLKISAVLCLGTGPAILHRIVRLHHEISFGLFCLSSSIGAIPGFVHDQFLAFFFFSFSPSSTSSHPHAFTGRSHTPSQPFFL